MPVTEPKSTKEIKVGPLAEQDSLLTTFQKGKKTAAAEKYSEHKAMDNKIHGIVASRKQIKTPEAPSGSIKAQGKKISTKRSAYK